MIVGGCVDTGQMAGKWGGGGNMAESIDWELEP